MLRKETTGPPGWELGDGPITHSRKTTGLRKPERSEHLVEPQSPYEEKRAMDGHYTIKTIMEQKCRIGNK